jgi:hypothetical protein
MFLAAFYAKCTLPISHMWFLNGKKYGANMLELCAVCAFLNILELVQYVFLHFALIYHTFISLMSFFLFHLLVCLDSLNRSTYDMIVIYFCFNLTQ